MMIFGDITNNVLKMYSLTNKTRYRADGIVYLSFLGNTVVQDGN